jgi:Group II intron, maturase-specific domain
VLTGTLALHRASAAGRDHMLAPAQTATRVDVRPRRALRTRSLIALCHSRDQAHEVKAALAEWLTPRGLTFNDDKTRIVSVDDGFDFLGFNVRRYPNGKLLITPSTTAVRRLRQRLRAEMRASRGANVGAVLRAINPIVRGWAAYYRTVVSSATFHRLDDHLWKLAYKWATHSHQNKPKRWIMSRYFGRFNPARNDHWVFGKPRPRQRRLPAEVLLDPDRATPTGQGHIVTRRPYPDRLLGRAAPQRAAPADGRRRPTSTQNTGRALCVVRRVPTAHRPRTPTPTRVGTMDRGHTQGDEQTPHRRARHGTRSTSRPRLLPPSHRR